ncbi:MAG: hypothetical protein HFG37_07330 [Eubacterium sp.]|nr:hypothetical protein [Eubacterium sp.]
MIRISITDKSEYTRLRNGFLKKVSEYVWFDQEDIIPNWEKDLNLRKQLKKRGRTKEAANDLKKNFPELYKYLFKRDSDEIDRNKLRYLLAGPQEMPKSFGGCGEEQTMLKCLESIIAACQLKNDVSKKTDARECCKRIFNYDRFVKGQKEAHWLLRNLNVRVCPYCNRIYTVSLPSPEELEKGEEFRATRATFDHFYNKAEYPYLSLSLFNLIPSCYTCNLNKSNTAEKIVYPYDQEFGKEAVFRIIPNLSKEMCDQKRNILSYLYGGNSEFYIKFMSNNDVYLSRDASLEQRLSDIENIDLREKIIASIGLFKLEELYKEHKQEIKDILRNRFYFDDHYVKTQICPMIRNKKQGTLEETDIEKIVMDMLFFSRIRSEEWAQRPLSKLISDILDQISS